jgi:TRAP-type C4-dicarboxylate transport system permease small subunit
MSLIRSLIRLLDRLATAILVLLMGAMGLIAFVAVFFRFVLHSPLTWSEESARYMMVWVTFMGAGLAMKRRRHIGITFVVDKLPDRIRLTVNTLAEVIIIAFMGIVTWQGLSLMLQLRTQVSPAMRFPMIIPYFAVPLGSFYMLLVTLELLLDRSTGALSTANTELEAIQEQKGESA